MVISLPASPRSSASARFSGLAQKEEAPRSTSTRSGLVVGMPCRSLTLARWRSRDRWITRLASWQPCWDDAGVLSSGRGGGWSRKAQSQAAELWDATASGPAARTAARNAPWGVSGAAAWW
jgi:hypothetical protein